MYLCIVHSFIVLPFLFELYSCQLQEMLLRHLSTLDDRICINSNRVFYVSSPTLVHCGALCLYNTECKSIFYKESNSYCSGCDGVYTEVDANTLATYAGTRYYRPYFSFYQDECSATNPCIDDRMVCFPGIEKCVCDPTRYVYSPHRLMCVDDCVSLGDTYQLYPRSVLWGHDGTRTLYQPNVTSCLELCTSEPECYGVDHGYITNANEFRCWNNIIPNADALTDWRHPQDNFDQYVRNCI